MNKCAIDDVIEMVEDTEKWLAATRRVLSTIEDNLLNVEGILDDVRFDNPRKEELTEAMEIVKKTRELSEGI